MYSIIWPMNAALGVVESSGQQRLQARYPDCFAAAVDTKNSTLLRFGRRDGQEGRQNIQVDLTP